MLNSRSVYGPKKPTNPLFVAFDGGDGGGGDGDDDGGGDGLG